MGLSSCHRRLDPPTGPAHQWWLPHAGLEPVLQCSAAQFMTLPVRNVATIEDAQRNFEFIDSYTIIGFGSPESVVKAPKGAHYRRRDGGAATCFYVKESADDLATGWVAK